MIISETIQEISGREDMFFEWNPPARLVGGGRKRFSDQRLFDTLFFEEEESGLSTNKASAVLESEKH